MNRSSIFYRLVLSSLLMTGGCATTAPVPEDRFYRLLDTPELKKQSTTAYNGTLKVEPIKAFGIYRERAILFTHSDSPETLRQHHYHHWIDTPTRLIREQLVDYFRKSAIATRVTGAQLAGKSDFRLHLELKHFERIIHPSGDVAVKIRLDAILSDASNQTILTRSYVREPMASDNSIAASVAAMNQALGDIYRELGSEIRER